MITDSEEILRLAREEKCQLRRVVEAKSHELTSAEDEVSVKFKALVDLEVVPTLSPDTWMDIA